MKDFRFHLLKLSGDFFEMGYAHGRAAKDAGALGPVEYYGTFLDALFRFGSRGAWDRRVRAVARDFFRLTVERNLSGMIPKPYRDLLAGFSEASGVPLRLLQAGQVMPDAYAYLAGRISVFLNMGCTSFVWASRRDSGPFLHARNLDYPGGEIWSRAPAVVEYSPKGAQRYAAVGTLGIDAAGITAMNEAGLTLSLHLNYSKRVSSRGLPIVLLGHEILRTATTLAQAVTIVRGAPKSAGWSLLVSSYRERSAVRLQFDAGGMSVQPMGGRHLVATNHFLDPEFARHEFWVTRGRELDSRDRFARVESRLAAFGEAEPSAAAAASVLADSTSPDGGAELRYGSTIAQVHTVSSAVFDPAERRVYVAAGVPPVSKSGFTAVDLFPGPAARDLRMDGAPENDLSRGRREYALAHDAYFPACRLDEVAARIEAAARLDPDGELYWFMLGLVRLKLDRFRESKIAFERALALPAPGHRSAQTRLYYARTLDLLGDREGALREYSTLKGHPVFGPAVKKALRRAYDIGDVHRLFLDFTLGDAIET